jgi:predicted MPP superfamily phosphohydrolase
VIECTEHRVAVPSLPPELRGLRIVQLTDLHRSKLTPDRRLRHAVALANSICPDLILLTGDFVTADSADIEPCGHILAPLEAPLGRYAVLGNHDFTAGAPAVERMLTRLGIHVLTNESVKLENGLRLVGLEDDRHGKPDAVRAFRDVQEDEATLVLSHNPVGAELVAQHPCIVFSGHTHGGQIRLPVLTAQQVRRIGSKHYRAGWFTVGQARLYVNRGLGQVGLPLRFLCRPEISLFILE